MFKSIAKLYAAPAAKHATHGQLVLESLEGRDLPSITWMPVGSSISLIGQIQVVGDGTNDKVTVTNKLNNAFNPYDDQVVVLRGTGNNVFSETATFNRYLNSGSLHIARITGVVATLGDGLNEFTNSTNVPSQVTGGKDRDVFRGGSGDDVLDGYGGDDTLYGNDGRDNLWGGTGTDILYGGNHNDGLCGGTGYDTLYGGGGADRFLRMPTRGLSNLFTVADPTTIDAVVMFKDGDATIMFGVNWESGTWTESDVRQVDVALEAMHRRLGNTTLLKTASGGSLVFVREGLPTTSSGILAWTDDLGTITITQRSFNAGPDWLSEVVFHEIGHNWDEPSENATVNQFRQLSEWTSMNDPSAAAKLATGNYTVSGDGEWLYANTAHFTRNYARTSPYEDFAESFAADFMKTIGRPFQGGDGASAIPEKLVVIDQFLAAYTMQLG